jgi:hypothetical protein
MTGVVRENFQDVIDFPIDLFGDRFLLNRLWSIVDVKAHCCHLTSSRKGCLSIIQLSFEAPELELTARVKFFLNNGGSGCNRSPTVPSSPAKANRSSNAWVCTRRMGYSDILTIENS